MPDALPDILLHQFEAALATLNLAVVRCPDPLWNQPVANWKFCQAAFHVTFFADIYLQPTDDIDALKHQPFHLDHPADFRDYEELEDRPQVLLYEKPFILAYIQHVRRKAHRTLPAESPETLAGASGFRRRNCSRAELHLYNIRHIQHHAAQLSLRLRLNHNLDIPWISHTWRDA
ncbi:MAG TPA: DinB family protein [Phycisphaerae bacterium]|nr:DinB family protein [Phycisphaerae bacterium]